jgi:hypothetical protein
MFRVLSALFVVGLLLALVGGPAVAKEEKEETLKGTITCAKCDLKVEGQTKCHTVIKVGDKVYWFDEKSSKDNHKKICTEAKEGTVVGTVKKEGDKMIVTPSKVEFK